MTGTEMILLLIILALAASSYIDTFPPTGRRRFWTCRDGRQIAICDLEDEHLLNIAAGLYGRSSHPLATQIREEVYDNRDLGYDLEKLVASDDFYVRMYGPRRFAHMEAQDWDLGTDADKGSH